MGYRPARTVYTLEFEDYPGMEVSCYGSALGELIEVSDLQFSMSEVDKNKQKEIFTFFASKLVTWNLEHPEVSTTDGLCSSCGSKPGVPLPTTVEGMLCLELKFIMTIILNWVAAMTRVSDPKGLSSNSGGMNMQDMMMQLGQLQSPMTSLEQN